MLLNSFPDSAAAHNNRGMAYKALGEFPRAIDDFNWVVEADTYLDSHVSRAAAYVNRAGCYHLLGEETRAMEDLERAIILTTDPVTRRAIERAISVLRRQENEPGTGPMVEQVYIPAVYVAG